MLIYVDFHSNLGRVGVFWGVVVVVVAVFISTLHLRKKRLREVKRAVEGPTRSKWRKVELSLENPHSGSHHSHPVRLSCNFQFHSFHKCFAALGVNEQY